MSEAIAQKLEEACALIERGWTQNAHARNAAGDISCKAGEQVCWCAYGAILMAGWPSGFENPLLDYEAIQVFQKVVGWPIADWNDAPERTQAEVIDAFKKAAELARGLK